MSSLRTPIDEDKNLDIREIENVGHLPSTGSEKHISTQDIINDSALVPIGGLKLTPEEIKLVGSTSRIGGINL